MSGHAQAPMALPGSRRSIGHTKPCSRCGLDKDHGGGIDISPVRWVCATCWIAKSNVGNFRGKIKQPK